MTEDYKYSKMLREHRGIAVLFTSGQRGCDEIVGIFDEVFALLREIKPCCKSISPMT